MKYIYGPLKSRRLGFSLGISLSAYKICNFDCIYCQLGVTKDKKEARGEYSDIREAITELKTWLEANTEEAGKLDYITISGAGEPTLHTRIGEVISEIKKLTTRPVAVITNASLLILPEVRSQLLAADLLIPSLDAATQGIFALVDRPLEEIKIEGIIQGLEALRREFRGKIWLEVMLVKGVNDDLRHIRKLKEAVDRIRPDKIQLNSPVRTTAQQDVSAPDKVKLTKIKGILGDRCEII